MNWALERDEHGEPARLVWLGPEPPCLHAHTRKGRPEVKEHCVNVPEICTNCRQPVAVTSWTREAWDEKEAKSTLKQQSGLFFEAM